MVTHFWQNNINCALPLKLPAFKCSSALLYEKALLNINHNL